MLLHWSRIRGIIFLVGFLPAVISLGLVGLKAAVSSQGFCMAVLKGAHEADKTNFPNGPPLYTLLVRAFLVRDTTDMQAMELQILDFDKKIAQSDRDQLRKDFEAAAKVAKRMEESYASQAEKKRKLDGEEQFIRNYRQNIDRAVRETEARAESIEGAVHARALDIAAQASAASAAATGGGGDLRRVISGSPGLPGGGDLRTAISASGISDVTTAAGDVATAAGGLARTAAAGSALGELQMAATSSLGGAIPSEMPDFARNMAAAASNLGMDSDGGTGSAMLGAAGRGAAASMAQVGNLTQQLQSNQTLASAGAAAAAAPEEPAPGATSPGTTEGSGRDGSPAAGSGDS